MQEVAGYYIHSTWYKYCYGLTVLLVVRSIMKSFQVDAIRTQVFTLEGQIFYKGMVLIALK